LSNTTQISASYISWTVNRLSFGNKLQICVTYSSFCEVCT